MPRKSSAWRRRSSRSSTVDAVREQLLRRRLKTVGDCRLAWERGGDPLAVCAAVMKTPMPDWLADALLALIFSGGVLGRTLLQSLWAKRDRDARDAARAWEVAQARTHPDLDATWDQAYKLGEYLTRTAESGRTTPAAARKSYRLVNKRLELNPGRYYCPDDTKAIVARLRLAQRRLLDTVTPE